MKPLLIGLALLAGLAIACGSNDSADDASSAGSIGSVGALGGADAPAPGPDAPSDSEVLADSAIAWVVVTSRLALEVTDLHESYRRAGEIARGLGGFVALGRLAMAPGDDVASNASMRMRVPYEQHEAVLDGLRDLGPRVISEEIETTEVTGEYTDLQSRIANLRRSEAQYQAFLERASSIEEVLDVASRLDEVRGEIEQLQGRLNVLADRSDFATVELALSMPAAAKAGGEGGGLPSPVAVFTRALSGSVQVMRAAANAAAVMLVVVVWAVPFSLVYFALHRPVRRLIQASRARLG